LLGFADLRVAFLVDLPFCLEAARKRPGGIEYSDLLRLPIRTSRYLGGSRRDEKSTASISSVSPPCSAIFDCPASLSSVVREQPLTRKGRSLLTKQ